MRFFFFLAVKNSNISCVFHNMTESGTLVQNEYVVKGA